MMKLTKLIAILLVMTTLLSLLVACKKDKTEEQTTVEQNTDEGLDPNLYDANGYLKDQLPDDINYGNKAVNIVCWNNHFGEYDPDANSQDLVDLSVYQRNTKVEERFGVDLVFNKISGQYEAQSEFVAAVEANLLAGDETYDLIASYSMCVMTMASDGILENLMDCQYLNFDNPWWPKTLTTQATVNDKLYGASGDIALSYYYSMFLIVMNKTVWDSHSLQGNVIEDVKTGEWTIDKMLNYAKEIYIDKNANGKDASDVYGIIFDHIVPIDMFISGSNMSFVTQEDGKFKMGDDMLDINKGDTIISKLGTALRSDYAYYGNQTDLSNAMKQGQALFYPASISKLGTDLAGGLDYDYYILPTPKYDSLQEQYYSNIGFTYTMYSIPKNGKDTDMPALLVEALASEGYRTSTDVLYEKKIKYRYSGTEEANVEMFELIRSYPYFEVSRFSFALFENRKMNPITIFRDCVVSYGKEGSNWNTRISSIKKLLSYYLENDLTAVFGDKA